MQLLKQSLTATNKTNTLKWRNFVFVFSTLWTVPFPLEVNLEFCRNKRKEKNEDVDILKGTTIYWMVIRKADQFPCFVFLSDFLNTVLLGFRRILWSSFPFQVECLYIYQRQQSTIRTNLPDMMVKYQTTVCSRMISCWYSNGYLTYLNYSLSSSPKDEKLGDYTRRVLFVGLSLQIFSLSRNHSNYPNPILIFLNDSYVIRTSWKLTRLYVMACYWAKVTLNDFYK